MSSFQDLLDARPPSVEDTMLVIVPKEHTYIARIDLSADTSEIIGFVRDGDRSFEGIAYQIALYYGNCLPTGYNVVVYVREAHSPVGFSHEADDEEDASDDDYSELEGLFSGEEFAGLEDLFESLDVLQAEDEEDVAPTTYTVTMTATLKTPTDEEDDEDED